MKTIFDIKISKSRYFSDFWFFFGNILSPERISIFDKTILKVILNVLKKDDYNIFLELAISMVVAGVLIYPAIFVTMFSKNIWLILFSDIVFFTMVFTFFPILRIISYNVSEFRSPSPRENISLFLRPFVADNYYKKFNFRVSHYFNISHSIIMGRSVVAVGSPHDKLPAYMGINTRIIQYTDDSWQSSVAKLISRAGMIVIVCGPEHWVHWEIRKVVELGQINRTIFILQRNGMRSQDVWINLFANLDDISKKAIENIDQTNIMCLRLCKTGVLVIRSESNSLSDLVPAIYIARYSLYEGL